MKRLGWLLFALVFITSCRPEPAGGTATENGDSISLVADDRSPDTSRFEEDTLAPNRENWQKPQAIISRLGDLSEKTVADIGAGTGYFTMRLAQKARKVIAIDIEAEYLDYISRASSSRKAQKMNIETRQTEVDDPSLHPDEADLVMVVNTFSYIDDRVHYFQKVLSGISPGGRLVVIDFKKRELPVGPPVETKVAAPYVVSQLDSAGFNAIEIDSSALEFQFIVTAYKLPEDAPTLPEGTPSPTPGTP